MALILAPTRIRGFFPAAAHYFETPKIFKHSNRTAAEHFDPLLRKGTIPVCEITDRAFGTVGKPQRHEDIVATVATAIAYRSGFDLHEQRSRDDHEQIDEVAYLSDDAPA